MPSRPPPTPSPLSFLAAGSPITMSASFACSASLASFSAAAAAAYSSSSLNTASHAAAMKGHGLGGGVSTKAVRSVGRQAFSAWVRAWNKTVQNSTFWSRVVSGTSRMPCSRMSHARVTKTATHPLTKSWSIDNSGDSAGVVPQGAFMWASSYAVARCVLHFFLNDSLTPAFSTASQMHLFRRSSSDHLYTDSCTIFSTSGSKVRASALDPLKQWWTQAVSAGA
mmetsp:Transcript_101232/g.309559  ORF Transcript_101232/g.309559 Transcript_101232/m.309559 type:complete len:224 (+) Transcript_101232:114-785(+)